jgi:Ferritin-like domain
VSGRVLEVFEAARTDATLLKAALEVEEVCAQAYDVAADGPLRGDERAFARRFAAHEREHAAALETMLFALTVPVGRRAAPGDLDELVPGLRGANRRGALRALAELEGAAIAGHQLMARRLKELEALRTVAAVMAGGSQHLVVLRHALGADQLTHVFETGS